jgi:ATP-dependent Clp protease ATP-binding subunit ClpC
MFERFSTASRRAVFCARLEAGFVGSQIIDSEHLLLGLLRVDPTTLQFIAQPVTLTSVREAAARWHVPGEKLPTSVDLPITEDVKLVFENAGSFADAYSSSLVRTEHLLLALMTITTSHAAAILGEVDASLSRLEQLVSGIQDHEIKTVLNFPEKISSPSNGPLVRHVVLQNGLR